MTIPVLPQEKFQWKDPVLPKEGEGKTSVSASFTHSGKKYEVTICYDKKGLQSSYGIDENEIDSRIRALFSQLELKDLASLSGVKINASLSNLQKSLITRANDGVSGTYEKLYKVEKYSHLCATAFKVISVFSKLKTENPKEDKTVKEGETVELKVSSEPKRPVRREEDNPLTIEFVEVDETPVVQKKRRDPHEGRES